MKSKMLLCSSLILALCATALNLNAQTPPVESGGGKTYAITGTMDIDFKSNKSKDEAGKPEKGVKDLFSLNVLVAETLEFNGKVDYLPAIFNGVGMASQDSSVYYSIDIGMRNPANLAAQGVPVGRFVGQVPIDSKGVYQYDRGTARIAIDQRGQAAGFESKFQGVAEGKTPEGGVFGGLAGLKKQALQLSKTVQGKKVVIAVTKYDKMNWDTTLPAGPVRVYPETRVTGELLFDYERSAWYFNGVTMTYQVNGKTVTDKLTGNIKWTKSPNYKSTGEGQYTFDVRVNEPEQAATTEAAVFAAADESAFFASDAGIPSLQGVMKYKDTLIRGDEDNVGASKVEIALTGNRLQKVQVVNLAKMLIFAAIVPMNSN